MQPPTTYESLFLAHLPFIEKATAATARVLGLRGDDAEELVSWTRERLWEDDYAMLRKWRGESKVSTYLASVITNLGREFRTRRHGRWRHSAGATKLGPIALRLEKLVYRNGWSLKEAIEILRQRRETDLSDRELADLFARIPHREPLRPQLISDMPHHAMAGEADADTAATAIEDDAERAAVQRKLEAALANLTPLAESTLRMHFLLGRSLADVARALAVPQKPLYRIKDNALRAVRSELEAQGVTWEGLQELLGGALADCGGHLATVYETGDNVETRDNSIARHSKEADDMDRGGGSGPSSPGPRSQRLAP